jgi:excisionase family DNA binding protein
VNKYDIFQILNFLYNRIFYIYFEYYLQVLLECGCSMTEGDVEKTVVGANAYAGLMTVHDLAEYLQLSEAKVYRLANAGQVPGCRVGKSWRFMKELIDEWIRRETEAGYHILG